MGRGERELATETLSTGNFAASEGNHDFTIDEPVSGAEIRTDYISTNVPLRIDTVWYRKSY